MNLYQNSLFGILNVADGKIYILGTQSASFSIDSSTGAVSTASVLDYETGPTSYGDGTVATLGIQATDGNGGTSEVALSVTVNDANDAPTFTQSTYTGTVDEEQASGAAVTFAVAIAATDEDGDSLTYSLSGIFDLKTWETFYIWKHIMKIKCITNKFTYCV